MLQYADPVADLLDKWGVFQARLFRDSCVFHHGSYVKVGCSCDNVPVVALQCLLGYFCVSEIYTSRYVNPVAVIF